MSLTITPPATDEYAPFYSGYITGLPEGDILEFLERQRQEIASILKWVAEEEWGTFRYQPGKWCVSDIIGHINDSERIFSTRALRFSRGDSTPLPSFSEDDYAFVAGAEGREVESLAEEFDLVRRSTIAMVTSWEKEALARKGTANNHEITVRALVYVIAGHANHHVNIMRERYRIKG